MLAKVRSPPVVSELDQPRTSTTANRETMRGLGLVTAVLLAAGTGSAFAVGRSSPVEDDRPAEVRIAAAGSAATAEDFAAEVKGSLSDQRGFTKIEAAFDVETKSVRLVLVVPGAQTAPGVLLSVNGEFFIEVPEHLNRGTKPWMRLPPSTAGEEAPDAFGAHNPLASYAALGAITGPIERVGTDKVRGVPTTHFRTTIDLTKMRRDSSFIDPEALRNVPFDVWLDDRDRPRRTRHTVVVKSPGGDRQLTTTVEAFDYGKPVSIKAPTPEQVREFDPTFGGAITPKPPH